MIKTLKSVLSRPYPSDRTLKHYPLIGFIVFMILALFHPFGLEQIPMAKRLVVELGYGLITMLVLFLNYFLFDWRRSRSNHKINWTIGWEIVSIMGIILGISICNTLYTCLLGYMHMKFITFLAFIGITAVIAIFPVTVVVLLTNNKHLKQYMRDAEAMGSKLQKQRRLMTNVNTTYFNFIGDSSQDHINVRADRIYYIQSHRNYLEFHYQDDGAYRTKLLRGTLKNAEISSRSFKFLQRCHRSYIVNINQIRSIAGNSLGYSLTLNAGKETIPVSRRYTKWFKQQILSGESFIS